MSTKTAATTTGFCCCGACSVTVPLPLRDPVNCHCGQCRALSGASFTTRVTASREKTTISSVDDLTRFRPTENLDRYFCKVCGTHVYTADIRLPKLYGFAAGIFDSGVVGGPTNAYFEEFRVFWECHRRASAEGEA